MDEDVEYDINELVLCMAKKIGDTTYRFFFQKEEIAPDFYGDDFEQKPASIVSDLEPDEQSFAVTYTAEAPEGIEFETSEFSNLFSMQDGLDDCVALMFDRDYDEDTDLSNNGRFVLHFGDNILDVADKLFKFRFELDDDFPQREPTDFITAKLTKEEADPEDLVLCRIKMHDKMKIREDLTSYTYDMFYIKRKRIQEFRRFDEWMNKRETQLYAVSFKDFQFDDESQIICDNVEFDTISDQNDYSIIECIDGCVCLAYENIDGKEYPENRVVFRFGDTKDIIENKLQGRGHILD